MAIFVAMVLDGLDGRVARLTRTQSAFGAEYDSLSDMVSFGAAPALIVYEWALKGMGKLGWIAAFVYVAGAALRLARFNVDARRRRQALVHRDAQPGRRRAGRGLRLDHRRLQHRPDRRCKWWAWAVTLFAGLTMVSNVPYYSFKTINLKKSVPFLAIFVFVLVIALLSYQPAIVLFAGFVGYALSGYVAAAWMWHRGGAGGARRRSRRRT